MKKLSDNPKWVATKTLWLLFFIITGYLLSMLYEDTLGYTGKCYNAIRNACEQIGYKQMFLKDYTIDASFCFLDEKENHSMTKWCKENWGELP